MNRILVLSIAVLVIVFTFTSPINPIAMFTSVDVALAQQQVQSATKEKPVVQQNVKGTQIVTLDAAMRELCLADGLTWKEDRITYVGVDDKPQCFQAEWHIFTYGGPQ